MSSKTVAKNSLYVLIARGVDTAGGIILVLLTARYLASRYGIEAPGQFAFVVTLIGLIFALSNMGLAQIIIRDVAKDKSLASAYLQSALFLRLVLGVLCALLLFGLAIYLPMTRDMRIGIVIAVLAEMGNVISWNYINMFNAFEKMNYEAVASIIFRLVTLVLTLLVIYFELHWVYFFVAIAIGSVLRMIYVIIQSVPLVKPSWKLDYPQMKMILFQALPIGFALLLTQGYIRIDVLLLKGLSTYREIAYFFYPYRVLLELNILPLALTTALFPVLARAGSNNGTNGKNQEIEKLFIPAFKYYVILSLPIMVFGFIYATPIMKTLFTERFAGSGPCLQIMIWATLFVFVELLMSHSLIATGHQRVLFLANGTCLVTNFIVDFILIKYFHMGAIGASIGTLSAYAILFFILLYHIRETVSVRKMMQQFPKPVLAVFLTGVCFYFLRDYLWYLMIPIGFLVYIGVLFVIRTFSEKEIDMFKHILRPPGEIRT